MRPDEEFSLPPEQSATLSGRRYGADRFGVPSRKLAEPGEIEEAAIGPVPEEGPGKAPEEEASPAEQDAQQTKARREKHRRSLLLQMAAAATSVVLVTSSFGIDVLGLDGLFNDSVILGEASTEHDSPERYDDEPELLFGDIMPFGGDRIFPGLSNEWTVTQDAMVDAHNRYIVTAEFTEGSMGEQAMVDGFIWSDRKEPQFFTGPIPMSFPGTKVSAESNAIRYDENTNTLTLHNYHGKGLVVNGMGQDFTIRLEGDNRLDEYLLVGGGSLTIIGDGGIVINEDNRFEYAVHVVGQWSDAYLMLDGSIKYNLTGRHSAIRVTSTCAEKPVWYTVREASKDVYQGQLHSENPSPITRDDNHYYSWVLCGGKDHSLVVKISNGYHPGKEGQTEPVQIETAPETEPEVTVTRLPVGGDSSFPMLPNPMPNAVGLDGQHHESSILAWEYLDRDGRIYGDMSIFAYEQHHPTGRDDIFYDPSSNTLTLNNFSGSRLDLRSMGNSFKIRLIGRNELSCGIQMMGDVTSGSITFTGDGYLALNTSRLSTYGLWLDAGSAPACVMIEASVTMDLYGSQAIAVWNTTADKAIYYLSGTVAGVYQESDYGEKSSSTGDTVYDWDSVDAQGNQVAHLHIGGEAPPETEPSADLPGLPIGGDASYPNLPNLEPGGTSPDGIRRAPQIIFFETPYGSDFEQFYLPDYNIGPMNTNSLSYDPASNTLTMNNYSGGRLEISNMGNGFTIRLIGRNVLNEGIYIQGDYLGSSIHFTGDGYLSLNSTVETSGLTMRGIYSETCLMIDSTVTMDLYGSDYAFWISDTSAEKAVYYASDEPLEGVRQYISGSMEEPSGTVPGMYSIWYPVDNEGKKVNHIHIGGENPSEANGLPVGGDSSFPVLGNPNPNTPVPTYGILDEDYIQVFDRQANRWEFLYLNRNQTQNTVSQSGISYDRSTNTLTLNNYHGAGISANMMGNSFTVELIGENVLTQDFMIWGFYTAGSVHFTGTGSLSINTDLVSPIGLDLECEFSESCIMIDESVTLDIYGSTYALVVNGTITDKGVYLISPAPRPGVRQTVYTQQMPDVDWVSQKPHKVWILTGSDTGDPLTRFRIEGTGRVNNR